MYFVNFYYKGDNNNDNNNKLKNYRMPNYY